MRWEFKQKGSAVHMYISMLWGCVNVSVRSPGKQIFYTTLVHDAAVATQVPSAPAGVLF